LGVRLSYTELTDDSAPARASPKRFPVAMFLVYYYALKLAFFAGLLRAFVAFEPLQRHWLFMAILYTAGVAFLSGAFLLNWDSAQGIRNWEIWLAKTLGLSVLYFWLLSRFDEGAIFWLLLMAGAALVIF
jgi:hypothetical protein